MGSGPSSASARISATEQELCDRALASRSARDVDALITAYPAAGCIPAALTAMPPETLRAVSPAALRRMAPAVRSQIPAQTAQYLRFLPDELVQDDGDGRSGPY